MSNISNPDAFNLESAYILSELYNHFPTPADWVLDDEGEYYPTATGQSRTQIQEDAIWWLRENGFLETPGKSGTRFQRMVLTGPGLNALKRTPKALGKSRTMIELIKEEMVKNSISGVGLLIAYYCKSLTEGK